MNYFDLAMPEPSAYAVLNNLGRLSALEFIDQHENNVSINKRYINYVRRCEECLFQ